MTSVEGLLNNAGEGIGMSSLVKTGFSLAVLLTFIFLMPTILAPAPSGTTGTDFNTDRTIERLKRLLGDERPHAADSDGSDAIRDRLVREMQAIGLSPTVTDGTGCRQYGSRVSCARVRNIIARIGPSSGDAILINTHYDSDAAGPGAGDDGIAVAVALEIADMLITKTSLARPVVLLFNEGEEDGLLGAEQFLRESPLSASITDVINLEARGTAGPVLMFETSYPNGSDIRAYARNLGRPAANSMMAEIYRRMPNGTDATLFLNAGMRVNNFAMLGNGLYYHTPRDNLANLSHATAQHMGDSAWATLQARLAETDIRSSDTAIYTDILGRYMLILPQWLALPIFGFGLFLAMAVFALTRERKFVSLIFPFAAIILGAALPMASHAIISELRPEAAYWRAIPHLSQLTSYIFGFSGGLLSAWLLSGYGRASLAAFWGGLSLIGITISFMLPGAAILLLPSIAAFGLGTLIAFFWVPAFHIGIITATAALFIVLLAQLPNMEDALNLGGVAALSGLFVGLTSAALVSLTGRHTGQAVIASMLVGVLIMIATLLAPAYTFERPGHLSLAYSHHTNTAETRWVARSPDREIPAAMATLAAWGTEGEQIHAPAELTEPLPASDLTAMRDGNRITISAQAPMADRIDISLKNGTRGQLVFRGRQFEGVSDLRCFGRSCRTLNAAFILPDDSSPVMIRSRTISYGAPASGTALIEARDLTHVQAFDGDQTIIITDSEI